MSLHLKSRLFYFVFLFCAYSFCEAQDLSQTKKNKNPFPVRYTSEADQKLMIKTITVAPVYDNVKKVYAEPIQKLLAELIQNDKVWGFSPFPETSKKIFIETYDANSKEVLEILKQTSAQGLLTAIITKGPNGLSAKLKLYTSDQGLLLAEESFQDLTAFEIPRLREEFITLYQNLKNKLPYRGFILSRRGLEVTINAGSKNGISVGQELTFAQILKVNRHPKLRILVSTEKEIIGRVQVTKVEPYLSFGQIILEKETGVLEVGTKLLPTESIAYPRPVINSNGEVIDDKAPSTSNSRPDQAANLTAEKKERPGLSSHLGKVVLQGGLSQYAESGSFNSGPSISTSQALAPTVFLDGEYWITTNWFVDLSILQSLFSASNPQAGSNPSSLNYTYSKYSGSIGYYYFLADNFSSPKLSAQAGFSNFKTNVSDSTPLAFTSTSTDSAFVKIAGSFPIEPDFPLEIGASFNILINPNLTESPVASGSSSSRVTSFSLNALYPFMQNLRYRFDLNFDQIQADFSGSGPKRSSTIKVTTQLFGIDYLF